MQCEAFDVARGMLIADCRIQRLPLSRFEAAWLSVASYALLIIWVGLPLSKQGCVYHTLRENANQLACPRWGTGV